MSAPGGGNRFGAHFCCFPFLLLVACCVGKASIIAERATGSPRRHDDRGALERHYSVEELAKIWGLSSRTIRRVFGDDTRRRSLGRNVAAALELGHGAVLTCPDVPFLDWKYADVNGKEIWRSNPIEFTQAAARIFSLYTYYRGEGDPQRRMLPSDQRGIDRALRSFTDRDSFLRHQRWLALIGEGTFSFGPLSNLERADLDYRAKGPGSWKHKALGTINEKDSANEVFHYDPCFEHSDWKLLHDALKDHQAEILTHILPRYELTGTYVSSA